MEKLCVNIIGRYVVWIKLNKDNLNLKAVTIIDHVSGWFEITQYYDKRDISIANLVGTAWLTRYPSPMEITYDQGS